MGIGLKFQGVKGWTRQKKRGQQRFAAQDPATMTALSSDLWTQAQSGSEVICKRLHVRRPCSVASQRDPLKVKLWRRHGFWRFLGEWYQGAGGISPTMEGVC
jgi:hypothetical protein